MIIKRNSLLFIFLFFVFFEASAYSDSGLLMSVCGFCLDKNTGKPFEGVEVVFCRKDKNKEEYDPYKDILSSKTDSTGFYCINELEEGLYSILFYLPNNKLAQMSYTGMRKDFYKIKIAKGQNMQVNFFVIIGDKHWVEREDVNKNIVNYNVFVWSEEHRKKIEETQKKNTKLQQKTLGAGCNSMNIDSGSAINYDFSDDTKAGACGYDQTISVSEIRCENGKCVFDYITLDASVQIFLHPVQWFMDRRWCKFDPTTQQKTDPVQELAYSCIINCATAHENYHFDIYINKVKELYQKYCDQLRMNADTCSLVVLLVKTI